MEIKERKLKGAFEITLKPIEDERGFFMRVFDDRIFSDFEINRNWVQENHSKSLRKGIVRGLHFQLPPFAETKLVRCVRGAILDIFVDLRYGSKTFGKWESIELSESNKKMTFIPKGFAHGFCTLTDTSEVLYKVDNFYSKEHEIGLIWNDINLGIDWPNENIILSEKDQKNISFTDFVNKYEGIHL